MEQKNQDGLYRFFLLPCVQPCIRHTHLGFVQNNPKNWYFLEIIRKSTFFLVGLATFFLLMAHLHHYPDYYYFIIIIIMLTRQCKEKKNNHVDYLVIQCTAPSHTFNVPWLPHTLLALITTWKEKRTGKYKKRMRFFPLSPRWYYYY